MISTHNVWSAARLRLELGSLEATPRRTLCCMNRLHRGRLVFHLACLLAAAICCGGLLHAQDEDGGMSHDSRGNEYLESLMLSAEWTRPLLTGGTFTTLNARPIRRDSAGRIYQERWLMEPKNANMKSTMTTIQIEDPVAGVFYQCLVRPRVCELRDLGSPSLRTVDPSQAKSGKLANGRGFRTHEDKGLDTVAGMPVHAYRDTTLVNAGTLGNDSPMTYVRDVKYSPQLGFNLTSVLQAPAIGEQHFTVTEITTSEPEARFFQPPEGYRIVDRRSSGAQQR